ncbi:hypothetical protein QN277_012018 [Acacia crassicarpa]|uniref:Bifunctional inhibitor/plant lipid transfer protein/seed storage helical domain-containing protein n=1 Tax=Acacia crassicarpa TaxID=499986 RepID=A0AAE1MZV9_9FABA|nr:hypothetical protein QN277_012018 [Acacia crassicarpa]
MASLIRTVVAAVVLVSAVIGGAEAQEDTSSCTNGVSRLTACEPFVVPGNNSAPSTECCSALGGVNHDCFCNSLRMAYQLPSQCQLPSFNCPPGFLFISNNNNNNNNNLSSHPASLASF